MTYLTFSGIAYNFVKTDISRFVLVLQQINEFGTNTHRIRGKQNCLDFTCRVRIKRISDSDRSVKHQERPLVDIILLKV